MLPHNSACLSLAARLALYDGTRTTDKKPGYVKHLDNVQLLGDVGENFRELTGIFYFNGLEGNEGDEGGGELRCYGETHELTRDLRPKAGRLGKSQTLCCLLGGV